MLLAVVSIPATYFLSRLMLTLEEEGLRIAFLFLGPVLAVLFILFAVFLAFRKAPEYERYRLRAERHLSLDPEQALADFSQAIAITPAKEKAGLFILLQKRADLLEKQGNVSKARSDHQQASELALELYKNGPKNDRLKFLEQRIDHVRKIAAPAEADREELEYLFAAEQSLPEEKTAMGVAEGIEQGTARAKRGKIQLRRKEILDAGRVKALGYCRKCKTVVELDPLLKCSVNPKHAKITSIQFVLAEDVETAKEEIAARR